ncbi:MAG TPA: tRNA pseudouridine(38-40) synthase TruA [Rectinemataceae bacterium]|nr:tRNA pseudouridine(38-40) synthase TruA [Rectinemataceae bacterium]
MPGSRNIRLVVAYDGSSYGGWQRQKNAASIQGELETAIGKMHGRALPVFAAGRTDAGVHARGQVANFYTDIRSIPAGRFVPALNKLLPRDIRVMAASEVDFDFHSRFDARLRRYRFFTAVGRTLDPFALRFAHQIARAPELGALNAAASLLIGENDFSTLSSARDPSPSKRRRVLEASFRWERELLVFEIAANAFLLRMVRSIVGSLLHWESEGRVVEATRSALAAGDRKLAGPTAPARGLFFWNAEYYPEPRRPGRGQWWSRRGYEETADDPEAEAESLDEGKIHSGATLENPRSPMPLEPGPEISPIRRPRRLVPGLGFVEE